METLHAYLPKMKGIPLTAGLDGITTWEFWVLVSADDQQIERLRRRLRLSGRFFFIFFVDMNYEDKF